MKVNQYLKIQLHLKKNQNVSRSMESMRLLILVFGSLKIFRNFDKCVNTFGQPSLRLGSSWNLFPNFLLKYIQVTQNSALNLKQLKNYQQNFRPVVQTFFEKHPLLCKFMLHFKFYSGPLSQCVRMEQKPHSTQVLSKRLFQHKYLRWITSFVQSMCFCSGFGKKQEMIKIQSYSF